MAQIVLLQLKHIKTISTFGPQSVAILFRWTTHWFKVEIEIPIAWIGKEVLFVWDSMSEAMIWKNGEPIQVKYR